MNRWRLIIREIAYRRWSFALGAACVAAAAAAPAGMRAMLQAHDLRTEAVAIDKERETRAEMVRLEDDYRRIMKRLGYNVLILPRDEAFAEMQVRGYPAATMPEEYAERLGRSGITTLNHLLPILQGRLEWPEAGRTVTVAGVRGQVPVAGRPEQMTPDGRYRSPIMEAVLAGSVDLGHDLATSMQLAPGKEVVIRGEKLKVNRVLPRRGNPDDQLLWAPLSLAQRWLDQPGRISGILALECVCAADALGKIKTEIAAILPDVQVFEFSSLVKVRAEARARAAAVHRTLMAAELEHRQELRRQRERLATVAVPAMAGAAMLLVMLLAFGNVRDRRLEIGVWRALGLRSHPILAVFLVRAALIGLAGAFPGYAAGLAAGVLLAGGGTATVAALFDPFTLALTVAAAPLLAAMACWPPAVHAANQDPADILRET